MLTHTPKNEPWYFTIDKYFAERGIRENDYRVHHDHESNGISSSLEDRTVSFEYSMFVVREIPTEMTKPIDILCDQCGLFFLNRKDSNEEDARLIFNVYKGIAVIEDVYAPEKFGEEFAGYRIEEKYPAEEIFLKVLDYFLARFKSKES